MLHEVGQSFERRAEKALQTIIQQGEKIMSALTDLQASVSALQADIGILQANQTTQEQQLTIVGTNVQAAITLIQGFQSGTINADDPQVEAVAQQLQAADAAVKTMQTNMGNDSTTLGNIASSLAAVEPTAPALAAAPAASASEKKA
jgi:chromosome segregation ATPase